MLLVPGGIPANWRIEDATTIHPRVILPATKASSLVRSVAVPNGTIVQSAHVQMVAGTTNVEIGLRQATSITSRTTPSAIFLAIGASGRTNLTITPYVPPAQLHVDSYKLVRLNYADASEVVGALVQGQQSLPTDQFHPTGSVFGLPAQGSISSGFQAGVVPQNAAVVQPLAERISETIAIDRRLNAVILSGDESEIARITDLISQIDVPVPSVMLQCQVVELTESAARNLGLSLSSSTSGPIVSGGFVAQNSYQTGGGGMQVSASLEAHLYATIASGGGRILATPRILALSGSPAQILTGDAIPIIQTLIYPGSPSIAQVSTNYITVGVNLQVQPRVTNDGNVISHIFAEVSSVSAFIPTPQGDVPQISLRQASTEAIAADGTPFVIGGLLRDEEIRNMSKLPILGDLPLIGGLFRQRHDSTDITNLYIIITPRVINNVTRKSNP